MDRTCLLGTEAAVAFPLANGSVKIYSTDQSVYDTRRETAPMLNLPPEKVIVENCYVGGGFEEKKMLLYNILVL